MNPKNNSLYIDFLEYKTVLRYVLLIAFVLLGGVILKDGIAILFALIIIYFSATKNLYRAIEFFFLWFFISNFFIGQGYITNEFLINYIAKPSFLLFLIFLFSFNKIPKQLLSAKYIIYWLAFLSITLFSSVTQGQSPFVIITISSFFMLYLLLQAKGIHENQYNNLLNLFVAVAIIQTIVSFLQVTQILSPPSRMMENGTGGQFLMTAGLDDVASGTFGAGASHLTSWYASLISLFLLIIWTITKKGKYIVLMVISFLQFATVDSKTIMVVTVLMLAYFIFFLLKERTLFRLSIRKFIFFIIIISIFSLFFIKEWNAYYQYYGVKTGGSRTSLSAVYGNEVENSKNLMLENIGDWGKIRGFQYVFEDFSNKPMQIIWGYGIQGYTYNGKMTKIENKDTPIMKLNNFTNSRSGLIKQFAVSGLFGLLLFAISIVMWYRYNITKNKNSYDIAKKSLLKIFLSFSLLASFLYSIDLTTIPLIAFAGIISICSKLSQHKTLKQLNIILQSKRRFKSY
jgi:hypothetical protein